MKPENHYDALEVSRNASPEVIKAAYKSLMQRYHPDRNPDDAVAAERSVLVAQAYEVLSDSDRRSAYDREVLRQRPAIPDGGGGGTKNLLRGGGNEESVPAGSWWLGLSFFLIVVALGYTSFNYIRDSLLTASSSSLVHMTGEASSGQMDSGMAIPVAARTMAALFVDIKVDLVKSGSTDQSDSAPTAHVLIIQSIDVVVGGFDSERFISFMESNKAYIEQKLIERLAEADPKQLAGLNGEQYLKRYILETLADVADTQLPPASPALVSNHYGVESISLPKSFNLMTRPATE